MKVSDEQIILADSRIRSGDVTVRQACRELKITTVTFYRRLNKLAQRSEEQGVLHQNVTLTIEQLDAKASQLLERLDVMLSTGKGYNEEKHDSLDVIKTTAMLLTNYRAALQRALVLVDNRSLTVNVTQKDAIISEWARDVLAPVLLDTVGRDAAYRVAERLKVIE